MSFNQSPADQIPDSIEFLSLIGADVPPSGEEQGETAIIAG